MTLFFTSTVFGGGVVGSGTPGSCTEAALEAALAGGGSVTFNCGGSHTITLTNQKTISADTVIDGGGVTTLDGGSSTCLFSVENGATLTLQNVVVQNGRSTQNGGAVYVERLSTLNVSSSTFSGNQAANGGAIALNGWGANDAGAALSITNSTFNNNVATAAGLVGGGNGGGAIYVSGGSTATVVGSTFTANRAVNGGGIHVLLANLTVTGSTFNGNIANG
ncbi:MAG: hypothetical protein KC419_18380, partial [Anaerolineales bacterium]|nr:hypothetical protein [Anaerolineales bacterium]